MPELNTDWAKDWLGRLRAWGAVRDADQIFQMQVEFQPLIGASGLSLDWGTGKVRRDASLDS